MTVGIDSDYINQPNSSHELYVKGSTLHYGNIQIKATDTTTRYAEAINSNGAVRLEAATNRGLYDPTTGSGQWIININTAGNHAYVPLWKNTGSGT